jgi:hypothetical protein
LEEIGYEARTLAVAGLAGRSVEKFELNATGEGSG